MSVAGIIAEFNPLHNGHKLLIDHAKNKLGADCVVIVMSGNFTQRGECTLMDKYERAKNAIEAGADIVIQMPVCASTSGAMDFAKCGVSLLEKTGVVDTLVFGSETKDLDKLLKASEKSREELLSFSDKPNSILAIEYLRALSSANSEIKPQLMQRHGSDHNDTVIDGSFPSSTAIRNAVKSGDISFLQNAVPEGTYNSVQKCIQDKTICFTEEFSSVMHYKLLTTEDFSPYMECNEDLSNKIIKYRGSFTAIDEFIGLLKSKDIRYSRLSRMLIHILLELKKDRLAALYETSHAPYLHILKASEKGMGYIKKIKELSDLPVFASVNEVKNTLSDPAEILLKSDILADDIYRSIITSKTKKVFPTEYTRKTCLL